jgi:hypothetical protein
VAVLIAGGGNALGILVALGLPHARTARDEPPLTAQPARTGADG